MPGWLRKRDRMPTISRRETRQASNGCEWYGDLRKKDGSTIRKD
jgi:hypothetical protein